LCDGVGEGIDPWGRGVDKEVEIELMRVEGYNLD
jgi:hypothetical protein